MGLSKITVNKYLNLMEGAFLVMRLEPYFHKYSKKTGEVSENLFKR